MFLTIHLFSFTIYNTSQYGISGDERKKEMPFEYRNYVFFSKDKFQTQSLCFAQISVVIVLITRYISILYHGKLSTASLSVIQIKNGCYVNSVFTCVICLVFDSGHSKTPLFPKETLIDHFYVWITFTSLWFCLFEKQIYEKRSCDTQLHCVHVCVCDWVFCKANEYRANGTKVTMRRIITMLFHSLVWAVIYKQ